jgi:hypothetical protein
VGGEREEIFRSLQDAVNERYQAITLDSDLDDEVDSFLWPEVDNILDLHFECTFDFDSELGIWNREVAVDGSD